MQTPEEIRQRLAVGIVEYLDKAVADGHVASDGAESLEIAKQCIADAFGIDMGDESKLQELSLKPFSLDKVFEVYLKTQVRVGVDSNSSGEKDNGLAPASTTDSISEERKRADEFKTEGNRLMMGKDFAGAIDAYTKAIELVRDSAIYFGNRSAAFSQSGDHEKAVADAKQALELDAAYLKGYSRLGHAYFGLGKFAEAADAYEKGLELDPENKVMASSLTTTRAKLDMERGDGSSSAGSMPEARPSSAASAGGGFDLGSLMNNPALMSMAQNMMANGGLDQLMNNPAVSRLAENYRNTGQMPNMSDMMNNPDIMNMARSLSGNTSSGDGRGGSADANNGSNPLASLMNNPNMMNMAQQFMRNSQNNSNNGSGSNSGGNNNNNNNNNTSS